MAAGDLLPVGYVAAGAGYGVIVSVDGAGVVTRHLPVAATTAAPLQRGGRVSLGHAYELDDAPSHERFFLVVSSTTFEVDVVLRAARALGTAKSGALQLPEGLEQTSFLVDKAAGR